MNFRPQNESTIDEDKFFSYVLMNRYANEIFPKGIFHPFGKKEILKSIENERVLQCAIASASILVNMQVELFL